MQYLGLLFSLAVLFINLWGLVLATGLGWRDRWGAAVFGPWVAVTGFFAIECFHGLGKLHWLGIFSTLASLGLIALSHSSRSPAWLGNWVLSRLPSWREEFTPRRLIGCGGVFLLLFFYALAWRAPYPDIDGSSEKLADFSYICSYYPGETIPVADVWLSPYRSAHYYSFQHYAAALAGRIFGWPLGTTYNFSYCLLAAFTGLAFAGAVRMFARRRWVQVLVVSAFVVGGSGVSGLVHLAYKSPQLWSTVRFIGTDVPYNNEPVATFLNAYKAKYPRLELPGESYAYTLFLGDYHPPFSGFYLLGAGVLAAALWQRTGQRRYAGLVGGTLTWSVLASTWTMPLQLAWIGGWALWNCHAWRRLWPAVVVGAAAVWFAGWVYLDVFTAAAAEYNTVFRLVPPGQHTPPLLFFVFLLPTIGVSLLALYSGKKELLLLGVGGAVYLAFSELVFIDDVYVIEFNRFNTTLKWWPWIAAAVLMVVAPLVIEQGTRRWVRVGTVILCAYPCLFAVDLARHWWGIDQASFAQFEGTRYLTRNDASRIMLSRLKLEPVGVVVERPNKDSFTNSAALPLFAGQRMWVGWFGHELLWHGFSNDIRQRHERVMQFYKGEMPSPVDWLLAERVDYVLWYQDADTNEAWEKINQSLGPAYRWQEFFTAADGRKSGLWRRSGGELNR